MNKMLMQANQVIKETNVLAVATLDKMNFPSLVVLTPLPIQRSIKSVLFYTSEHSTTFKNLMNSSQAALICFEEVNHSSIMLKGNLAVVPQAVQNPQLQASLNAFQKELHYTKPVILRFTTMAVKIRHDNHIDYQKLVQINNK
ncbi:pyridoxamine 5'-phosphate oxidase family protein [Bombilactobacillus bombi]|uniref:pyridoxamine 5'-phosphate oxidase family protein n=1 Tax=Bombilactobacillus bombi TaxID=1303590 RepID=UPI0015E5ED20|nr:pyridoxamine 5'-phosphate oxidase family protein [Bombilactobacillus bombi]MBA1434475.1 pyridoxamine 5'-phosphate oxidase family protein [Bombilactobacillus bombi]